MESNHTIPITTDYKVLVGCMTYNHSKYIVDALNGFAMQKTNFPFACIVMDDASTDGEPDVIMGWLQKECDMKRADFYNLELANVIFVPHKTNTNCTFAIYLLKRNLFKEQNLKFDLVKDWVGHGEYLALCDGDDYWTDITKLQSQADCLDRHPHVGICIHSYSEVKNDNGISIHNYSEKECIIPIDQIILYNTYIPAAGSIFIRIKLLVPIPSIILLFPTDYSLMLYGSLRGGAYYLPYSMSAYRTDIPNSMTKIMNDDFTIYNEFLRREIQALKIFDTETEYSYHRIIQSRILIDCATSINSPSFFIKSFFTYWGGIKEVPRTIKVSLFAKCILPKAIQARIRNRKKTTLS